MASQTGSIDLTASNDAAKTATNYATDITGGGVMVHPSDDATSGVKITSDVDIMRDGTSVINIGTNDAVRIGLEGSGYVLVDSSGMTVHNSDGIPCLVVSSSGGMEALYKKFLIGGARVYARTSPATEMYQVNFGTSYEFASGAILNIVLRGYAGGDIFNYTCRFEVGTSSTVNLQNALNKAEYQVYYDGAHYAYLRRTSSAENDDHTDYYYQVSYAETTVNVHAPSIAMDGSVSDHAPYSSSFGEGLLVSSDHQTVLGRYNVEDANDSNALIIGNGLFDDSIGELVRSNALTVDWDGNLACNNFGVKTTSHSASSVTISAGGNYYASLGSLTAMDGFVPVGVSFNLTSMSNYANLFPSSLQDNGTYIWARIHNFDSSSSTGSWSATVYWVASN